MHTKNITKIEFDPGKDAANITKHGVSLALTESLEWNLILSREDDREDYGEVRMAGYAPIGPRVYAVAYVETGEVYGLSACARPNRKRSGIMHVKSKSGRTFDIPDTDEERKIREGISADEEAFYLAYWSIPMAFEHDAQRTVSVIQSAFFAGQNAKADEMRAALGIPKIETEV